MSVAILSDEKLVAQIDIFESGKQAEQLIPTIEQALNKAQIWYQDLDLLAITNGPGSFTGVRVGFCAAKAMQLGTDFPAIGVGSLYAIAYDYRLGSYHNQQYQKILVVMDARLDEFFIQEFAIKDGVLTVEYEAQVIACDEIKNYLPKEKFLLAGSAKSLVHQQLGAGQSLAILADGEDYIKAGNVALLARELHQKGVSDGIDIAYIRKARISKRKN